MDMQLKLLICFVSLIVFTVVLFQFILCVRCQNCRRGNAGFLNMYKWKRQALIDTVHTGSRDGWRTVTERINFHSDHFRNDFQKLGHSDGYADVRRTVPCRTDFFTNYYCCPDCNFRWTKDFRRTYNL
jgi:hypothetical protein